MQIQNDGLNFILMLLEHHSQKLRAVVTSHETALNIPSSETHIWILSRNPCSLVVCKPRYFIRLVWSTGSTLRLSFIAVNDMGRFRFLVLVLPGHFSVRTVSVILVILGNVFGTGIVDNAGIEVLVTVKVRIRVKEFKLLLLRSQLIQFLLEIQYLFFLLSIFGHHFHLFIDHFLQPIFSII